MYTIKKSTPALVEATRVEWLKQADNLGDLGPYISTDVSGKIDDIVRKSEKEKDYHAYLLVEDGCDFGCAILDIVHACPNHPDAWLKLLDITMSPDLNKDSACGGELEYFGKVFDVTGHAIASVISLIFDDFKSVKSVKIYGRTTLMRDIFKLLGASSSVINTIQSIAGLKARVESSWLVIEKA